MTAPATRARARLLDTGIVDYMQGLRDQDGAETTRTFRLVGEPAASRWQAVGMPGAGQGFQGHDTYARLHECMDDSAAPSYARMLIRGRGGEPMADQRQSSLFDVAPGAGPERQRTVQGVVVREVRCKSLLNRCSIDDYSFNCYVGCAHGCRYCYARFMQRFHPHQEEWGGFVDVKINAVEVLARQLRRLLPGEVFTCSACDGWQPVEEQYKLTRECCRLLLDAGFRLNILTKSSLVLRDLDLFTGRSVRLAVTITTPDEQWARIWEPGAASVADRVQILKQARARGLETAIMFGPLLPEISDCEEALARLFALAAEARVDHVWTDTLNSRPRVWPSVQGVLRRYRPGLEAHYRRIVFDPASRLQYLRDLEERIHRAATNTGLTGKLA
jgi:DNA repair photolyase